MKRIMMIMAILMLPVFLFSRSTKNIHKNIVVDGTSLFKKHMHTKQGIHVAGKLKVDKSAKFKDSVTIKDMLSVNNLVVLSCVDTLCVHNISVVDESISGNLFVNNEVVTNLTVANCMNNLCVNNLFVTEEEVGSLVVDCDLTVGCNISMNDSLNANVGNVIKNGTPFLHNFGTNNTFLGDNAGNFSMTGIENVAIGTNVMIINTSGSDNVAVGYQALAANTEGSFNTAVGKFALLNNTTGIDNVAVGQNCLTSNTIGTQNTAVGSNVMGNTTTGTSNTAVGFIALFANTTGSYNTSIGSSTMERNTTGSFNTAVGIGSLFSNVTGSQNVSVGFNSLVFNTMGDNNVALGTAALANTTAGVNNIGVGSFAGTNFNGSESNNIMIGNPGVVGDNNIIRIGESQTATFIAGINGVTTGLPAIPVLVDANGQLGTISSSSRFKHDIADMNDASMKLYDLHPVTFVYNNDESARRQYGLIAEEVAQVFPDMVIYDEHGEPFTVQYQVLPVLLLNELQKQQVFIKALAENFGKRIAALEAQA